MLKSIKSKFKSIQTFLAEESIKKYAAVFAVILAVMLICELFVFNFKWVNSAFDKEITVDSGDIAYSGCSESNGQIKFTSDSASIEIKNINQKIKYISINPGDVDNLVATATVAAKDEGNSDYLSAPSRSIAGGADRSKYIRLHFSGDVEALKVSITGLSGRTVSDDFIRLNTKVPLMFSWLRFLLLSVLLMLLYMLRPKSFIYKYKTDLKKNWQRVTAAVILIVMCVIFWNMINWNTSVIGWHKTYDHHKQYYELTEALKNGHFYLDAQPSQALLNMENPYDFKARYAQNADFKWDHAYYEGKYYVYFGVLPAVLLYLPYNLITGQNLPNYIAVYIFGIMIMIGIMLLLWEIVKKWYKNTPFALYLIMLVVFAAVSGIAYAVQKPDFYLIPNLSALMFALFGLAFWLSSERETENGETVLVPWRLVLGSLFVALTAGCRPQFLLTAVFGIMLFWNHAFKKRSLFSRTSIKQTVSVCLPFVIVGAAVMWYNAARFGSPFDFGANYNLTTNDMTARGFVFGRTGLGIFTYFLQPLSVNAVFPFIHDFSSATTYQGLTLTEKLMGGVLWLYPVLLIGVYGSLKRKVFTDKRAYRMVYLSVIMAVVLAVLDAQMAGLLTRYFTDFVWLMMIASTVTVFAYYDRSIKDTTARSKIIKITIVLSLMSVILAFLSIFAHSEDSIQSANPTLYYTIQHLIAFWM